ncbi:5-hydroxytryptamine receptor 7-like [Paramuricea clavata]|uniref:5-hydroxytryptamine receptor 7-like n=1 Tax=Paramuricea clavata TaxID=317549 RepID=A0A7D9DH17_PARCT|nr:5-hydroxytryptamine receptor 7-like [Paramuricea clavata]
MSNYSCSSKLDGDDDPVILMVFHSIFLFLGVLGNIAVIIYNIFLNQEKTPSSRLVTHLALADLLVCLTFYATKIVQFFHEEVKDEWTTNTAFYTSLFLSITMLLSITIDKYLYIAKPLKYPLIVTTRRTSKLLTCIWLAALVIQLPLMYISMDHNKTCIKYPCSRLVLWLQIIQQLAAICVMTTLNYKMFKIVKEQRQRMASEFVLQPQQSESEQNMHWLRHLAKEVKAMKTFAIIVGVLTSCFVPSVVLTVMFNTSNRYSYTAYLIILELLGINSVANAFIYALRHKKYTRAYRKLFSSAWARLFPQNN